MKVEIAPVVHEDLNELVTIQCQAFKPLYDTYHDEGNPYLRGADEILQWLERPNWYVYKIMSDGVLCGGVSFCEQRGRPGEYYLVRIYILPNMQNKGIASRALALCEAEVCNANSWTLDFPAELIPNRRCYEKAGYTNTGETREQSGGKIVLAIYEKKLLPFRDIKSQLDNPVVRQIMSYSAFDQSPEAMDYKAFEFRKHKGWLLYGWVEKGEIVGVCGFEVHSDYVEILNIAVAEHARGCGIGKAIVTAICKRYEMAIEAETDDDAVGFYRKCGFETTATIKYNVRRWVCVCPATEQLN